MFFQCVVEIEGLTLQQKTQKKKQWFYVFSLPAVTTATGLIGIQFGGDGWLHLFEQFPCQLDECGRCQWALFSVPCILKFQFGMSRKKQNKAACVILNCSYRRKGFKEGKVGLKGVYRQDYFSPPAALHLLGRSERWKRLHIPPRNVTSFWRSICCDWNNTIFPFLLHFSLCYSWYQWLYQKQTFITY